MPAAIQRRASRLNTPSTRRGSQCRWVDGCAARPQKYRVSSSDHDSAGQLPLRCHNKTRLSGQGSAAQQTPQPLQETPGEGLPGAAACSNTVWQCAVKEVAAGVGAVSPSSAQFRPLASIVCPERSTYPLRNRERFPNNGMS